MLILTGLTAMIIAPFTFFHETKFSFGDEERMAWRLSCEQAQTDVRTWFAERGGRLLEQPPLWWSPTAHPEAEGVQRDYFAGRLESGQPYYAEVAYLDFGLGEESSAVCVPLASAAGQSPGNATIPCSIGTLWSVREIAFRVGLAIAACKPTKTGKQQWNNRRERGCDRALALRLRHGANSVGDEGIARLTLKIDASRTGEIVDASVHLGGSTRLVGTHPRNEHTESASLAEFAFDAYFAAEQLAQLFYDRETQSRARVFARPVVVPQDGGPLAEFFENQFAIGLGNADARIGHRKLDKPAPIGPRADDDASPFRRKLDRVGKQVGQNLLHLGLILIHHWEVGFDIHSQVDVFVVGQRADEIALSRYDGVDAEFAGPHFHFPASILATSRMSLIISRSLRPEF